MRKKKTETKVAVIETHKYFKSDTQKVLEKMNKAISSYKFEYRDDPQFIIISYELSALFDIELSLMTQRQMIMVLNDKPLEFYSLFGVPCIVSKALNGLQFEVR